MTDIPATYEAARDQFRTSLASLINRWPAARSISHSLADAPDLTIDALSADAAREKKKLLILTTGLHGIEGYIGAGILQLFIKEYLPRLRPATTGVLLVQPINPYGMKHRTRVNKNSVDLNRNFESDFDALKALNPHYESLSYLINPARPLTYPLYEKLAFIWNVLITLPKGPRFIREAALMGQYRIHNGMYFGGFEPQKETIFMQNLLRDSISEYKQVVALDIHSGYGPRWQMALLNPPSTKQTAEETASRFKVPLVAGVNPDEFYTIHGDMMNYVFNLIESEYPDKKFYTGTFEFGTYGASLWQGIHSLRTTALEHCLRWFGGSDLARSWMNHEYNELFLPDEPKWWLKAQADARQAFDGILSAEGYFEE